MGNKRVSKSRRAILNSALGVSAAGLVAPSSWTKPIVNAVILPSHADMSPIPVVCPAIVVGAVSRSVNGSGAVACTLSFTFLSDTTTPLDITDISFTPPTAVIDAVTLVDGTTFMGVTDSIGPEVVIGFTQLGGACIDPNAITLAGTDDVTFTVEATCEGAVESFTTDFTLSEIAAML